MKHDRILDIYNELLKNQECYELLKNHSFEPSWLKEILDVNDFNRLEENIMEFILKNNQIYFKAGFIHAWELFHQCNVKK